MLYQLYIHIYVHILYLTPPWSLSIAVYDFEIPNQLAAPIGSTPPFTSTIYSKFRLCERPIARAESTLFPLTQLPNVQWFAASLGIMCVFCVANFILKSFHFRSPPVNLYFFRVSFPYVHVSSMLQSGENELYGLHCFRYREKAPSLWFPRLSAPRKCFLFTIYPVGGWMFQLHSLGWTIILDWLTDCEVQQSRKANGQTYLKAFNHLSCNSPREKM